MIGWLLRAIGMPDEMIVHLEQTSVAVHNPRVLALGIALLAPLAYFVLRRQKRNLLDASAALRGVLTVLRIAVLVLLVLILADPYLKLDHETEEKPLVAFLFDQSPSMELPVGDFSDEREAMRNAQAAGMMVEGASLESKHRAALAATSRGTHARNVMRRALPGLLDDLTRKYAVQFYAFARQTRAIADDPLGPDFGGTSGPGGPSSHLGDAIVNAIDQAGERPIAGLILVTDGENTGGRSLAEAARIAASTHAPIFSVPVGSPGRLRDIAVTDVYTSGLASVGDTVAVTATVESDGFEKRAVKVELRDAGKLVDIKELVLRTTEQQHVDLTFKPGGPGAHHLTVTIPPQPEEPEVLRFNNSGTATVQVSAAKLRVLYVEGMPRWDYRYLKNAMHRDHGLAGRASTEPDIVLEREWRLRPAAEQATSLPRTLKELTDYDLVILGDASPNVLDTPLIDLLDQAVREHGVGLIVAAGPQFMPHAYGDKLHALLPVNVSQAAGLEPTLDQGFRLELTPEGAIHEALRFSDDPTRNLDIWAHLPSYHWCWPAERPAPGAAVLVCNPGIRGPAGKLPLIASHYVGKGKVLAIGTDSTWLWRQNAGDRLFYKFWGQCIRSTARRDPTSADSDTLAVFPAQARPGQAVQVELKAFTTERLPRAEQTLTIKIEQGGTTDALELSADPANSGTYRGTWTPRQDGACRLTFAPGNGRPPAEALLRLIGRDEEFRHPNVNRSALQILATTTGGHLVELPDLNTIPSSLKAEKKVIALHREVPLWDNWLVFSIVAGLYCLDVGLRRMMGLS